MKLLNEQLNFLEVIVDAIESKAADLRDGMQVGLRRFYDATLGSLGFSTVFLGFFLGSIV